MLKIKKLFLLFFFLFSFSLFSYYRPEISIYYWRNGLYGSIYPMVTLDGKLSNPLDQNLHPLLGHHQYISPTTTISDISHSLHNQHNNILHTTYHIQQPNYIHQQPIHSITWTCTMHAGSCSVMQIGPNLVVCGYASITWSLIGAILVYFPYLTPLFDRLCRHMTWWLCIVVQFWLFYCVPWLFQASTNPSFWLNPLNALQSGQHKSLIVVYISL